MTDTHYNYLTVTGQGVTKMLKSIKSKDSEFDFKRVKPYPFTFKFNGWRTARADATHT